MIVKKAGTAISNWDQLIFPKEETISTPTMIKAGAVTGDVIIDKTVKKNIDSKKNPAVTSAANPVRAPAATPDDDST